MTIVSAGLTREALDIYRLYKASGGKRPSEMWRHAVLVAIAQQEVRQTLLQ